MLFLTIPLAIALGALIGISVVVWRKMPFLRKLTPESHEVGDTWLHDMAPEVIDWYRGIEWRRYTQAILVEFEKLLRRARLMMSALDRASDTLVRKVRRVHQETAKQVQETQEVREAAKEEAAKEEEDREDDFDMNDAEQLKAEEQRLIVAIAQNPKDADLYLRLARVYGKLKNYADAVESLVAATKLDPENTLLSKRLESARRRLAAQQASRASL